MAKVGTIALFAGTKLPKEWHFCDGQSMNVDSNPLLFLILGNRYGGDGRVIFQLPKLEDKFGMRYIICIEGDYAGQISYEVDFSEDNLVGMAVPFKGSQAPNGWAFCDGKKLDPTSEDRYLCAMVQSKFDLIEHRNFILPKTGTESYVICKQGYML